MKYSNGDTYEGVFEYDLRSKQGKMTYKDGSVYEGSWANGLVTIDCFILIHLTFDTTNEPCFPNSTVILKYLHFLSSQRHGKGKMFYSHKKSKFEGRIGRHIDFILSKLISYALTLW